MPIARVACRGELDPLRRRRRRSRESRKRQCEGMDDEVEWRPKNVKKKVCREYPVCCADAEVESGGHFECVLLQ